MGPEVAAALLGASIAAGVELIKAVGAALTGGRSVIIEIDNNTDLTLGKITDHHESGGFQELPHLTISPHSVEVFSSQSKGGSVATGTVGSVTYGADGLEMLIGWNNPFAGDNSTNVGPFNSGLGGLKAKRFVVLHQTGSGNQAAHMRFMLFAHPPYSVKEIFGNRGDLSQGIFKVVGIESGSGIRDQLPNDTSVDVT